MMYLLILVIFSVLTMAEAKYSKCTVTLYQHEDFTGHSVSLGIGDYNGELQQAGVKNDDVSSLKVSQGCFTTFYEHTEYRGTAVTFGPGSYDLNQMLAKGFRNDILSSLKINTFPVENQYQKDGSTGGWGGYCTCPDGSRYAVGDNHDACGSLACVNGTTGRCYQRDGEWSHKTVTCAAPVQNWHRKDVSTGGWGGYCTCPDGSRYAVGDNYDACGSLACGNGTPGQCYRKDGEWSHKSVTCVAPVGPVGCEKHKNLGESILQECRIDTANGFEGLDRDSCDCVFKRLQKHPEMVKDCFTSNGMDFKNMCAPFHTEEEEETPVVGCEKHNTLGQSIFRECRIDAVNALNRASCDCAFKKVQKHPEMLKDCAKDISHFKAICAKLPKGKKCSSENGVCLCKGYVKYGVENHWSTWKRVDGMISCNSLVFEDPKYGTWKHCVCQPEEKRSYECHRYNHKNPDLPRNDKQCASTREFYFTGGNNQNYSGCGSCSCCRERQ